MLSINRLSKIGFGCYRISHRNAEHYQALLYALAQGCNLIDTSANYMNGESEILIGNVLRENPQFDAFVITKAGYIQNDNLRVIETLNEQGLATDDLITLSDDFKYSIHPDFLKNQIELSRNRLQRECLDGFLLHNPEHYFEQDEGSISQDEYYGRIKKAFEFLEEQVAAGTLRYYGISSNTFPFSAEKRETTNLHRTLALANEVSVHHHFKLIQFPFNLIETDALKQHHGNTSLIELAKENELTTFSNRPLNSKTVDGMLRLATYEDETVELDPANDGRIFDDALALINERLREVGVEDDALEFTIIKLLKDNWMSIGQPEAVAQVFQEHFYPFLDHLYQGDVPANEKRVFFRLYQYATLYAKKNMTVKATELRTQLIAEGIFSESDERPLPLVACEHYLRSGIDHVLVGMRNKKYVDSLVPLF